MKTKEMIEIMKAYDEGKTIVCCSYEANTIARELGYEGAEWIEISKPIWDWSTYEYSVKEKPKYRPYKDKDELLDDLAYKGNNYHNIWIKNKIDGSLSMIMEYNVNGIGRIGHGYRVSTLTYLFDNYTFEDGTPFGIKITK